MQSTGSFDFDLKKSGRSVFALQDVTAGTVDMVDNQGTAAFHFGDDGRLFIDSAALSADAGAVEQGEVAAHPSADVSDGWAGYHPELPGGLWADRMGIDADDAPALVSEASSGCPAKPQEAKAFQLEADKAEEIALRVGKGNVGGVPHLDVKWRIGYAGGKVAGDAEGQIFTVTPRTNLKIICDFKCENPTTITTQVDHVDYRPGPLEKRLFCSTLDFDLLRTGDKKSKCYQNLVFETLPDGTQTGTTQYAIEVANDAYFNLL